MDISKAMQVVERTMYDVLDSDVPTLRDASRHIIEAGGKRVRPRLVMLGYAATGGTDFDYAAPVAAAVELVHTASVVHDDINDHGAMRRGRPSVNAIWGRTFALLTGDYLFTKVYELMGPYKDLNILLAEATIALVEGETMQAAAAKEGNLSREIYYQIIARKTAALFKAGAQLGGELASATQEQIQALANYGYNIGLAFQIIDDILDLIADDEQLGKSAGIDIEQGKGYAVVHANSNGSVSAVENVAVADDPIARIKQKAREGNTIEEGRQQAEFFVQQALEALAPIPASAARDHLVDLAEMIIERDH